MFRGLVQSSRDWQYIMLLMIWEFNLLLTHNSSTSHQISYPCSLPIRPSMHVAWWQMASTSPEGLPPLCDEGGKRRTSFSVSCGFRCPHTLPYMSQFFHACVYIQLSFTNATLVDLQWIKLNTKYKYNHFLWTLPPALPVACVLILITYLLLYITGGSLSLIVPRQKIWEERT